MNLPYQATIYAGSDTLLYSGSLYNFFVGLNAGSLTTSGNDNTAIGDLALNNNTSEPQTRPSDLRRLATTSAAQEIRPSAIKRFSSTRAVSTMRPEVLALSKTARTITTSWPLAIKPSSMTTP